MKADSPELYAAIKADKRLFIESCFKIVDGDTQQSVPFIYRPVQDKYWRNRTLCDEILKPRKEGFSALVDAEFLAACILEPHTHAVVVAHREEDTQMLFERVMWMKDNLPFDVPVRSQGANHANFTQTDSDFRVITARGKDPGRGRDITHLHLSERGFYVDEGFLAAVEGACVRNARRIIETTANGAGTPFHKHWLKSKRGETAYKTHFFAWWEDPRYELEVPASGLVEYDDSERALREAYNLSDRKLAWRRQKLREMSNPDLFPQEYPANDQEAFLVSGRMVFDWLAIQKMAGAVQTPKWKGRLVNRGQRIELNPSQEGELTIWEMPKENRRYLISADVAAGVQGGAYSVADVLDMQTWEQVAQWRGHISPPAFSDILGDLGAYYNWALVAPEVNNHGLTTISRLRDEGYSNLYARQITDTRTDYGFETNGRTKLEIINGLADVLRRLEIKINSETTLEELKSYVYLRSESDGGNLSREVTGPQAGAFADTVMSLAIGVAILNETRETPVSARQRFREALGLPRRSAPAYQPKGAYGVRKV